MAPCSPRLNRMLKNNAGYDLKQLFIGSEGTLGVVTRAELRLVSRTRSQETLLASLPSFDALVELLGRLDSGLGGQLAAFEALWGNYYDYNTAPPAQNSAPLARGAPFYAIAETLGGDPEHDRARLESVLGEALDDGRGHRRHHREFGNGAARHLEHPRGRLAGEEHRAAAHFRREPADREHEGLRAARFATPCAAFAGRNRCFVFGHMADGNLHIVIAAGDDAATRAKIEDMVYRPLAAHRRFGVRRTRHRPREARLSTAVAYRGGDLHHAPAQAGARSQGHPQSRQGVRMSAARASQSSRKREVTVAATAVRLRLGRRREHRHRRSGWCAQAAKQGAQIILIQELFETPYFCIEQDSRHLRVRDHAWPTTAPSSISRRSRASSDVVLPISFFEKANNSFFNSIAILDADGTQSRRVPQGAHPEWSRLPGEELLQPRRHRLQGVGHEVRAHRRRHLLGPVVSGVRARDGAHGRGAAVLSDGHRQRAAAGAAGEFARSLAAHAAGPCGRESHAGHRLEPHRHRARTAGSGRLYIRFYGSSFIADSTGAKVAEAGEEGEAVLTAKFDLAANEELRNNWFVFRDRRPDLYGALTTYDGGTHGRASPKNWPRSMHCSRTPTSITTGRSTSPSSGCWCANSTIADGERELRIGFTETDVDRTAASTSTNSARGGSAAERPQGLRRVGSWIRRLFQTPVDRRIDSRCICRCVASAAHKARVPVPRAVVYTIEGMALLGEVALKPDDR